MLYYELSVEMTKGRGRRKWAERQRAGTNNEKCGND